MRAGRMNSGMFSIDGQLVAINLGADFTAEHEWGFDKLKATFGVSDKEKPFGIKRRKITKSSHLAVKGQKYAMIVGEGDYSLSHRQETFTSETIDQIVDNALIGKSRETSVYPIHNDALMPRYEYVGRKVKVKDDWQFSGAWSDNDFGILFNMQDEEAAKAYEDLVEALEKNDIAFWIGGGIKGNPFDRGGFTLGIVSRVPKEGAEEMKAVDKDAFELKKAAKKTGIEKRLNAASEKDAKERGSRYGSKCSFHALSPRWYEGKFKPIDRDELETKHDVIFWLNPQDQQNNSAGWYTVEQLDEWIDGKGPIPGGRAAKEKANS